MGALVLSGNMCGARARVGKKTKTQIPLSQQAQAEQQGPGLAGHPSLPSPAHLSGCLCPSRLRGFLCPLPSTPWEGGRTGAHWGTGWFMGVVGPPRLSERRCPRCSPLRLGALWARPKVHAQRRPGWGPGGGCGGGWGVSEVAEDLTLPVPVHLWRPLVDPGGPRLLLGLSRRGAQVEATLLERVTLPGAAVLGVDTVARWPE